MAATAEIPCATLSGDMQCFSVTRATPNQFLFVPVEPHTCSKKRPQRNSLKGLDRKADARNGQPRAAGEGTDRLRQIPWSINGGESSVPADGSFCQTLSIARSPALPASGPVISVSSVNVAETAQWLFCNRLRTSQAHLYASARKHWVDELWDLAKQHDLVLKCVSLSMILKKAALIGRMNWASYFAEKATLMQGLQLCLRRSHERGFDPALALAIAMLAELESRDVKDASTARMHVEALARLVPTTHLQGIAWRYAVRVDLRQSLWTGQKPVLPYWIPWAYEMPLPASLVAWQCDLCLQLADGNTQMTPSCAAFPPRWSYELFRDLHLLSFSCDTMVWNNEPPFGAVYSLGHQIRLLYAELQAYDDGTVDGGLVELTLIALQLQAWIVSRYWVSQIRGVQSKTLRRAFDLLDKDLLQTWSSSTSTESLLWVLVTLASARFDICAYDNSLLNDLLGQICRTLNIKSLDVFKAELKRWPWLDNWTAARVELVWAELSSIVVGSAHSSLLSRDALQLAEDFRNGSGNNGGWFVGGLEFYNSL